MQVAQNVPTTVLEKYKNFFQISVVFSVRYDEKDVSEEKLDIFDSHSKKRPFGKQFLKKNDWNFSKIFATLTFV